MPIDLSQPHDQFNGAVFLHLVTLYQDTQAEGLTIPPSTYTDALLSAVIYPADRGTLTIDITPQATLMLRWVDAAGQQMRVREVGLGETPQG